MKLPAAPSQGNLHLDTRFHMFAVDNDGKQIISEVDGKPVQIARDLASGTWYAKVAQSMPFFGTKEQKSGLQELIDQDGIHVAHDDERFRGVWVPLGDIAVDTDDDDTEEANGDDTEHAEGDGDGKPPHKTAAKKTASKKPGRRVN